MNERKTTGLPDKIYGDILNRILEGEYKEGERLPTEHALAERFATSRPTVREALARLREYVPPARSAASPGAEMTGAVGLPVMP